MPRDNAEIRRYLERIPKHGVIAEIGVWRGRFARLLRSACQPRKLILVDPWKPYGHPAEPLSRADAEKHEQCYRRVCQAFEGDPSVEIWRLPSVEAAVKASKEGIRFAFVYIDADHRYEHVLQDLEAWHGLVGDNCFLGGHDYVNPPGREDLGVVRAVTEFCSRHPWKLLCVTKESWPSFLLQRA